MTLPPVDRLDSLPHPYRHALREVFRRSGFGTSTIELADSIASNASGMVRLPIVRNDLGRRTEPSFHLALLFSFAGALPRSRVDALLGGDLTDALLAAGILTATGDDIACPFRMVPGEGYWLLCDDRIDHVDSVMPPGPTTAMLAQIMPRDFAGSMIDVGCGPGSHAIVAATRGARRVLGTDINPRAITMARFNAAWNELEIEFRVGDLLAPAAGERFDLVVSQPPYISHPATVEPVTFLHGGPRGDTIFLRLMTDLADALTENGEALVLSDVALGKDESLGTYLRDRLPPLDLHVLALYLSGVDAETHALIYSGFGSFDMGAGYVREVLAQRAHLATIGIERFQHTLFVARRPGPARREAWRTSIAARDIACVGPAVRQQLWSAIRSAGDSDAVLLQRRIRVAPDARWMSLRSAPEGEQSEHRVRFGSGWPALEQVVTDEGVVLASLLERSERVEDAIAGYAEMCDARPDEVRKPLLDYIRRSLLSGMFVPVEAA